MVPTEELPRSPGHQSSQVLFESSVRPLGFQMVTTIDLSTLLGHRHKSKLQPCWALPLGNPSVLMALPMVHKSKVIFRS